MDTTENFPRRSSAGTPGAPRGTGIGKAEIAGGALRVRERSTLRVSGEHGELVARCEIGARGGARGDEREHHGRSDDDDGRQGRRGNERRSEKRRCGRGRRATRVARVDSSADPVEFGKASNDANVGAASANARRRTTKADIWGAASVCRRRGVTRGGSPLHLREEGRLSERGSCES